MSIQHFTLANSIYFVGRSLSRLYTKFELRKQIYKKQILPRGPKIFAVNHPSTLDPLYVMSVIKSPVHALLIEDVFKIRILKHLITWGGHIKVETENARVALQQAISLLKKKRSILIFPEGHVSRDSHKLNKIKTGVVRMALATGVPIIPIGITLDPSKIKKSLITIKGHTTEFVWYRRGAYQIHYGESIYLTGSQTDRSLVKTLSCRVQQLIQALLNQQPATAKLPIANQL